MLRRLEDTKLMEEREEQRHGPRLSMIMERLVLS